MPQLAIALAILWNLWWLRSESNQVAYLNDSAMHESMVRFANQSLLNFHFPMTQWYPWLNLGSPQFLHYQGLGATLAGFLGLIFQPDFVFRWSLYLMIALWPIAVYKSSRIMGLSRKAQIAATLISPWLISVPLVGYEQKAYIWIGYGVWAQLCASWALPFAWAWTWRAIQDRRHALKAVFWIALTVALHYETGYMAIGAVVLMVLAVPSEWRTRLKNMAVVLVGALIASSWVTVPLLMNREWAAINTAIAPTGLVRGYGARSNLEWLFKGQLFDNHRVFPVLHFPFPIITACVFLGIVAAIFRWKTDHLGRVLVVLFTGFFLISWGPTTWGSFIAVIPGHSDIYFRRFQMSVSMAGILLAGYGIAWLASLIARYIAKRGREESSTTQRSLGHISALSSLALAVIVALLSIPLMLSYDQLNARDIGQQRQYESNMTPYITPIVQFLKGANNGRVYAGLPNNWGMNFTVGYVPVFEYMTSQDVDQVGFTLRTASLMEQPEAEFNENIPADYALFGIRYLLLPVRKSPMVPATPIMTEGPYKLWAIQSNGYFSIVVPSGSLDENKGTIAAQAPAILNNAYYSHYVDFRVNWAVTSTNIVLPTQAFNRPVGRTLYTKIDLLHGDASGVFSLRRPANVVLSASFDPGWQAWVDGKPVATQMLAPALVSVPVPAGVHTVTFHYQGFQYYLELLIFSLLGLWWARRISKRAPIPTVAPTEPSLTASAATIDGDQDAARASQNSSSANADEELALHEPDTMSETSEHHEDDAVGDQETD